MDNFAAGRHRLAALDGIDVVEGDIRDEDVVRTAMVGVDTVFHEAAEVSVTASVLDPRITYDVNVMGTLNVLSAAYDAKCRRVVFASSSAVYGDAPSLPKTEAMLPSPASPYAASKLAGEDLCATFCSTYGLETVVLRYFNVYGPSQDRHSPYAAVIPNFVAALDQGEQPTIYGDGTQSRDFVYVDDVVEANLLAAAAPKAAGRVYNIASGEPVSLHELLAVLSPLVGGSSSPVYRSARAGDIRHSAGNPARAREELGFEAAVPLPVGLARVVAHYRQHAAPERSRPGLADRSMNGSRLLACGDRG